LDGVRATKRERFGLNPAFGAFALPAMPDSSSASETSSSDGRRRLATMAYVLVALLLGIAIVREFNRARKVHAVKAHAMNAGRSANAASSGHV
jgi:hypothetical protein